jgi:dTDP-4-amino-4,6-dideoxygalactose transaminase
MVGTFGAISAFSTMFGKHHATGAQGGVVFTRETLLFARARQVIDRGKPFGALGNPTNVIASLNFNQDEISMAIGRVQLEKLPGALSVRRKFAALVANGLNGVKGVSFIGDAPGCSGSYWFLCLLIDREDLNCDSKQFAGALELEGIGGVQAGYPFIPTDQPWHRDAAVFGTSGMPWSLRKLPRPNCFELPNAHATNQAIVRVDMHETLGAREAQDLVAAVKKVAQYYRETKRSTVSVDAVEAASTTT